MVQEQGYKSVETFLNIYSEAKEIVKQWEKGKYTKKESIIEKLKILEKEANLYQQNIEYYKEIER